MSGSLRIVHLASLARSGETVLLRTLAAHPQVHVVHDLNASDSEADLRLYRLLRVWPEPQLPRWQVDQHLAPGTVAADKTVLLLKQGVFAPRFDAAGFGLLRNPYAAFCSLWSYDALRLGRRPGLALNQRHWQQFRLPRLLVWADAMLPALLPALRAEPDPVRQYLLFWTARVAQIQRAQRCVLHYETFVQQPESELRRVCEAIELPWDASLLQAHRRFRAGERGHGGIDLGAPIRPAPAWRPDPLVDLAPFADAVDQGPVPAYRGLYSAAPAAEPAASLDDRLLASRRGLRALQGSLDDLLAQTRALQAADPLALALEVSLLRKLDPPAYDQMRALLLAPGPAQPLDEAGAPLALALEQLDPQDPEHQQLVCRLLDRLPALALGKLFRWPALPRNADLLVALGQRLLDAEAPDRLQSTGWFNLLVLAYAVFPPPLFDSLLQRLRQPAADALGQRLQALARRFVLAGDAPPVAARPVPARLRIALCLSGQMRGWRQARASWHLLGLDGHAVDVYIHTWRDLGRRLPDPEIMPSVPRLFADPAFSAAYIRIGQRVGLAALQAAYPRFFAALAARDELDRDAVAAAFGPGATIVVDDDRDPDFARWSNQDRMHHKIWAAQQLAAASGREHDLVIRLRPDKLVAGRQAAPDWAALAATSRAQRALFCEEPLGLREGLVMGDQFAAGAPEVMAAYADTWLLAPRASELGWDGVPPRFTGHASLAFSCLWQGLRPRKLPGVDFGPMAEAAQLGRAEIRALLALDLPDGPRHAMVGSPGTELEFAL